MKIAALACIFLLIASVLNLPTARAETDSDGDGLSDSFELSTLYAQTAEGDGLPKDLPDNGEEAAVATLLPWAGVVDGAFAEFTVDHPSVEELTVQVGYWDGSSWNDMYVWDPGGRLMGVTLTSPAANSFLQGVVTVTASVQEDEILDRVEFYLGAERIKTLSQPAAAETYSFSWDTRLHSAGDHQLKAVAIDKVGAQASHQMAVKIDNADPSVSITSPANGAVVSGSVTISASASDDYGMKEVRFYVDGSLLATDSSDPYSVTWSPSSSGTHTLMAQAVDQAGKTASHSVSVLVDGSLPSVSFASPSSGAYLRGTYRVKVQAIDDTGITKVELKVDSGGYVDITGNFDGTYYWYDWSTASVANGDHTLTARATDQAVKTNTASVSVKVDNTSPSVSITNPRSGATVSGSVRIDVSASDNMGISKVKFYVDGKYIGQDTSSPYYKYWDSSGVIDGRHTLKAVAVDRAGNTASHSISVYTSNSGGSCSRPPCPVSVEPQPTKEGRGKGGGITLSTTTAMTTSSFTASGSTYTVVADLIKDRSQVTQVERDNRILPAEFDPTLFHAQMAWRIVIRDWVTSVSSGGGGGGGGGCPGCPIPTGGDLLTASTQLATDSTGGTTIQGTLQALTIRLEERSDLSTWDTDGDGLGDGQEVNTHGTYPVTVDTDGDDASDDFEVVSQSITLTVDGVSQTVTVKTDPSNPDTDTDGLVDGEEYYLGVDGVVTHPVDADTDDDGLSDGDEATVHYSNATLTDTDGDGFTDFVEVNPRSLVLTVNGVTETRSVTTLAYAEDSDGDGLRDDEEWYGTSVYGVKTDPSDPDTDGDGMPDGGERYVREASTTYRRSVGTSVNIPLTASVAGSLEKAEVRYGLSSIDVSNLYLRLDKGSSSVVLRDHVGTGLYNYSSVDITDTFSHGGAYSLYVSSSLDGGILEEFALSFTILTSPILDDTDGDGLNDTEEVTHGVDGWITDPNQEDTDGDGSWDGRDHTECFENFCWNVPGEPSMGTSPLATDTDGDGALDPDDIDPLKNILVRVKVKEAHHGGAWWDPELAVVVRVNDDYTWVTKHEMGGADYTASFYYSYHADVPDDASTVEVRATAWSFNDLRGDDLIEDGTVTYALGSGLESYTISGGSSWITFEVSTVYLSKAKTLLITDGNVTVASTGGQTRMAAHDRFIVLTLNLTSASAPFVTGVNTILVPRSIFLETKLKADFDAGSYSPLSTATLYGEDLAADEISEGVAGLIAATLTGSQAADVLDRLLRNATDVEVYDYADITSRAAVANLPLDVVRILPWVGVVNGPTGAMPQDFWQKIGAVATTLVNVLLEAGQLIYDGLVALGTFLVNLGEAIWEWGMQVAGEVSQTVVEAVEKVADTLSSLFDWIVEALTTAFQWIVDQAVALYEDFARQLFRLVENLVTMSAEEAAEAFWRVMLFSTFGLLLMGGFIGLSVFAKWTEVASFGTSKLLTPLINALVGVLLGAFVVSKLYDVIGSSVAEEYIDPGFDEHVAWSFTLGKFIMWTGTAGAAVMRMWKTVDAAVAQFFVATLSLVVLSLKTVNQERNVDAQTRLLVNAVLSGGGFALAWFTKGYSFNIGVHRWYSLFFPIATAFSIFAKGTSAVALLDDTIEYVAYVNGG
ncbi:MAG: Ig-like domain-containing protein [Thermoplasmata archaeon]